MGLSLGGLLSQEGKRGEDSKGGGQEREGRRERIRGGLGICLVQTAKARGSRQETGGAREGETRAGC